MTHKNYIFRNSCYQSITELFGVFLNHHAVNEIMTENKDHIQKEAVVNVKINVLKMIQKLLKKANPAVRIRLSDLKKSSIELYKNDTDPDVKYFVDELNKI